MKNKDLIIGNGTAKPTHFLLTKTQQELLEKFQKNPKVKYVCNFQRRAGLNTVAKLLEEMLYAE